jgi:hypothetical protein
MTKQDPVEHDLVKHDPLKQGWMQGFPPAKEKLIRFEARSFYAWPQLRWSLSHLEELVPTKNVWRGPNASRPLPYNLQSFDDAVITSTTGEALSWQAA